MKKVNLLSVIIIFLSAIIFSTTACNRDIKASKPTLDSAGSYGEAMVSKLISDFEIAVDEMFELTLRAREGDSIAITQLASPALLNSLYSIMMELAAAEDRGEITEEHKAKVNSIQQKYEDLARTF